MTKTTSTAKNIRPSVNLSTQALQSVFGTSDITLEQRTEYYFGLWRQWWANGVFLKSSIDKHTARRILNALGLNEFEDFQIRFRQVRFSDKTILAMAVMSDLKNHISHRTQED